MTDVAGPLAASDFEIVDAPDALAQQARMVARIRRAYARLVAEIKAAEDALRVSLAEKIAEKQYEAGALEAAEAQLRALAIEHFTRTGERKPTPGVEIKMKTSLDYDAVAALAWAKQTGLALVPESVDDKALRQIAKATPLPFVTTTETPQAQIATDLEKALGSGA